MNLAMTVLLGLVLLFAPIFAALPDEPLWSSWLCAGTMLAVLPAVGAARRGGPAGWLRVSRAETAFLVLLGLAFLSIPCRLIVQHGTGYFGLMLRGWGLLATNFALFALARRLGSDRRCLYGLIAAALVGSAIVADIGVQEYAAHVRAGQSSWRIFGTSTPDYLAGYFVLLIPLTLALFLEAPSLKGLTPLIRGAIVIVLGVVLVFQLVSLEATSSRFALVSLVVSLLTFAVATIRIVRRGYRFGRMTRYLAIGLLLCVLLAGGRSAKPLISRLHTLHDNSAAFRVWTWKGSIKMAAANPLLGTGVGTWPDMYPPYAYTGFTRVAHNGYLQLADECGIPALLVLLAALGLLGVSLTRGLAVTPIVEVPILPPSPISQSRKGKRAPAPVVPAPKTDYLPQDHRLLLCGLIAALAGGIVQNLIDSDWYIFFLGTTFWTLAGLAAGIADLAAVNDARPAPKPVLIAVGSVAAALCAFLAAQGIAASYGNQAPALIGADPAGAAQAYGAARAWDPLNGRYPSDEGYKVYYQRGGDLGQAETAVRTAVALEPNSVNYRRLGNILQAGGSQMEALQAYQAGLRAEPNSLDLLNDLAWLTPLPGSLDYYKRISDLEMTPVGTVRALGEMTETKFARADVVMGEQAAKANKSEAIRYYTRAATVLEKFAEEGGSLNEQRLAMEGGRPNPSLDVDMRGLYERVMNDWIPLVPADQQTVLTQQRQEYLTKLDEVYAKSSNPGKIEGRF